MTTQRADFEILKQFWRFEIELRPDRPHPLLVDHFFSSEAPSCVEQVIDVHKILGMINSPNGLDETSMILSIDQALKTDYLDLDALSWYFGTHHNPPRVFDAAGVRVPIADHSKGYLWDIQFEDLSPDRRTHLTLYNFGEKRSVYIGALRSVITGYVGKKNKETNNKLTEGLARTSGGRPSLSGFPEEVEWEEVAITFKTRDTVEIRARSFSKKFHYAELTFKDNRVTDRADKQWGVLLAMAINGGSLSWNGPGLQVKTSIYILRRRLKTLTGIDDDPFHPYRTAKEYSPRFTLVAEESVRRHFEADNQESDINEVYLDEITPH